MSGWARVQYFDLWTIWLYSTAANQKGADQFNFERAVLLGYLCYISVVALFSCLNLTFMAYGIKHNRSCGDYIASR